MDTVMAASVIAAAGAGAVAGMLLVPAEVRRVRRIGALGGLRAGQRLTLIDPAAKGPLQLWLNKLSGYLADRDLTLVAGAGFSEAATVIYRQWRPILPVVAGILAACLAAGRADWLVWLVSAPVVAILLPETILRLLASRRRSRILREFPELIDLLGVAAAGGSSLAGALRSAVAGASGPIYEEVKVAIGEAAAGTPLHTALRQLAGRIGLPAVSAFVGSVCEAESLGVPLADNLAAQSETARLAYRQQVESRLNQLPLQMTICALVFLFPTAFIVVALPNIIAFTRGLW